MPACTLFNCDFVVTNYQYRSWPIEKMTGVQDALGQQRGSLKLKAGFH